MTDYDVIVVGAGPIGSTYAYKMAKKGYNVAMYDKKRKVGQPLQCAGLVSTNINSTKNLPKEFIKNKVKGAVLSSPNNTSITVKKEEPVAYVLDRVGYDKYLLERAIDNGVDFKSSKVSDINVEDTIITVDNDKITSKIIAVASGPNSTTSKKINPNLDDEYFNAVQYTIKNEKSNPDFVNLNINVDILPGFIWSVPVDDTTTRVGLFTDKTFVEANQILEKYVKLNNYEVLEKHSGYIPKFNDKKIITHNNTILLGDSASQVKPTTGGGLIVGFNSAEIASINSAKMLEENNNKYLKQYEKEYHKKYNNEFKTQLNVQKIIKSMTDDDFNYMFEKLIEYNVDEIISKEGDMDTQTPLIKELLKTGIIFKLAPKIGVRRLKNIWKSQ